MRRRRRSRGWRAAVVVEEAFDLFLDALANTLGVIMFIALMVVLFSVPDRPTGAESPVTPQPDPSEARQVAELLEEARALEEALLRAPREGDPDLRRRAEALDERLRQLRAEVVDVLERTATASDALVIARHEVASAQRTTLELSERRRRLERRIASLPDTASFVRLSRFRSDERRPVLLLIAAGRIERAEPSPGETHILPGARNPRPITTLEQARALLDALLAGASPSTHRIEIGVWSDSFGEYKVLERLLVDRGYDLNPLPVPLGAALEAGTGGIQ